jgi:hypothetical protein
MEEAGNTDLKEKTKTFMFFIRSYFTSPQRTAKMILHILSCSFLESELNNVQFLAVPGRNITVISLPRFRSSGLLVSSACV